MKWRNWFKKNVRQTTPAEKLEVNQSAHLHDEVIGSTKKSFIGKDDVKTYSQKPSDYHMFKFLQNSMPD